MFQVFEAMLSQPVIVGEEEDCQGTRGGRVEAIGRWIKSGNDTREIRKQDENHKTADNEKKILSPLPHVRFKKSQNTFNNQFEDIPKSQSIIRNDGVLGPLKLSVPEQRQQDNQCHDQKGVGHIGRHGLRHLTQKRKIHEIWKPDSIKPDQMDPIDPTMFHNRLPLSLEDACKALHTDGNKNRREANHKSHWIEIKKEFPEIDNCTGNNEEEKQLQDVFSV